LLVELYVVNGIKVLFLYGPKDLELCKSEVLFEDEVNSTSSDGDYDDDIDGTVEDDSPDHLPTHERLGFNIRNVG
jgi:hypothetical protein